MIELHDIEEYYNAAEELVLRAGKVRFHILCIKTGSDI